jgi:L-seryl-tRNA(Ser) seleniumtransferase
VTLAALEATTEIHLSGNALTQIPLLQMLSRTPQDVRQACEDLARHIRSVSLPAANAAPAVDVVECTSQVGGGSVPGSQIQSFGIRISGINSDLLAQQIRTGTPAVLGRIQDDALLLDLRTVDPSQYQVLATALTTALRSVCGSQHSADDESQGDG